jgi:hypothetical protein
MNLFTKEDVHHRAVAKVETRFEQIIQDLSSALDSITSELQFMESQRAVMEAESISRLTELAFLFIPLSFAALFSMQARELSQPPPVAYFVAFALPLSATTYALRILARSSWVHQSKQRFSASVRAHRGLAPGAPLTNKAIVVWLLEKVIPTEWTDSAFNPWPFSLPFHPTGFQQRFHFSVEH